MNSVKTAKRPLLFQIDRHPKVSKDNGQGVLEAILHLAPANLSGYEVCPNRSAGCTAACLNTAGKQWPGRNDKQAARIRRTRFYFDDRQAFMKQLADEIGRHQRFCEKRGLIAGVRLNGTSDIPWERMPFEMGGFMRLPNIMTAFPDVRFMDYTKRANRRDLPPNYRLTFSRSEDNEAACERAIENGMNIAIVFRGPLPQRWTVGKYTNIRVIDGDAHDWRFGDYDQFPNERIIVGLKAKGKGKHDMSGFVVDVPTASLIFNPEKRKMNL